MGLYLQLFIAHNVYIMYCTEWFKIKREKKAMKYSSDVHQTHDLFYKAVTTNRTFGKKNRTKS